MASATGGSVLVHRREPPQGRDLHGNHQRQQDDHRAHDGDGRRRAEELGAHPRTEGAQRAFLKELKLSKNKYIAGFAERTLENRFAEPKARK